MVERLLNGLAVGVLMLGALAGPWNGVAAAFCHPNGINCFLNGVPAGAYSCVSQSSTGDIDINTECVISGLQPTPMRGGLLVAGFGAAAPAAQATGTVNQSASTSAAAMETGSSATVSSVAPTASPGSHGTVDLRIQRGNATGPALNFTFILDRDAPDVVWSNASLRQTGSIAANQAGNLSFQYAFTVAAKPHAHHTFIGWVAWDDQGGEARGWLGFHLASVTPESKRSDALAGGLVAAALAACAVLLVRRRRA